MSNPSNIHPLAPEAETPHEAKENRTQSVRLRSAIEIGSMRWVLGIGMLFAVVAFAAAYLLGYVPHS